MWKGETCLEEQSLRNVPWCGFQRTLREPCPCSKKCKHLQCVAVWKFPIRKFGSIIYTGDNSTWDNNLWQCGNRSSGVEEEAPKPLCSVLTPALCVWVCLPEPWNADRNKQFQSVCVVCSHLTHRAPSHCCTHLPRCLKCPLPHSPPCPQIPSCWYLGTFAPVGATAKHTPELWHWSN